MPELREPTYFIVYLVFSSLLTVHVFIKAMFIFIIIYYIVMLLLIFYFCRFFCIHIFLCYIRYRELILVHHYRCNDLPPVFFLCFLVAMGIVSPFLKATDPAGMTSFMRSYLLD